MLQLAVSVAGDARMEQDKTLYESLGGEAGVRALVARFYELMDELPEARDLRRLHPGDLERSAHRLFMYFSGWFGGPQLYVNERGHPRLRMRHFPFSIGQRERDQWMLCMRQALAEVVDDAQVRVVIERACDGLATHMIND
jgi:hemoglobin